MALAIVIALFAVQLQPPVPTPPKAGQKEQQQPNLKQSDAEPLNGKAEVSPPLLDSKTNTNSRPHQNESDPQNGKTPPDWWGAANTGLVTLFTGVLTFVGVMQWRLMQMQSSHMRDELRLDQRAWVGFMTPEISELVVNQPIELVVITKNYGRTPGVECGSANRVVVFQSELSRLPGASDDLKQVIADGGSDKATEKIHAPDMITKSNSRVPDTWTKEQISKIMAKEWHLLVFSRIEYRDVFGQLHFSESCHRFEPSVREIWGHTKYNRME
jgi:hypothetical protein